MSYGMGERLKNKLHMFHGARSEPSPICPVCKKRALSRYYDENTKSWIYKHRKLVDGPRGKVFESSYHKLEK